MRESLEELGRRICAKANATAKPVQCYEISPESTGWALMETRIERA